MAGEAGTNVVWLASEQALLSAGSGEPARIEEVGQFRHLWDVLLECLRLDLTGRFIVVESPGLPSWASA
jgi:hypothetical protein